MPWGSRARATIRARSHVSAPTAAEARGRAGCTTPGEMPPRRLGGSRRARAGGQHTAGPAVPCAGWTRCRRIAGWNAIPPQSPARGTVFAADHGSQRRGQRLPEGITKRLARSPRVDPRSAIRSPRRRHSERSTRCRQTPPTSATKQRFDGELDGVWRRGGRVDRSTKTPRPGRMGIGNTTQSAAVAAALAGGETRLVGREPAS